MTAPRPPEWNRARALALRLEGDVERLASMLRALGAVGGVGVVAELGRQLVDDGASIMAQFVEGAVAALRGATIRTVVVDPPAGSTP